MGTISKPSKGTIPIFQIYIFSLFIRPQVLRGVGTPNTTVQFSLKPGGQTSSSAAKTFTFPYPIGFAPSAAHGMAYPGGENVTVIGTYVLYMK